MMIYSLLSPIVDTFEYLLRKNAAKRTVIYNLNEDKKEESYDFTIVVPAYNEEKRIKKCLSSIEAYKDRVIIVDDASSDLTAEIAKGLGFEVMKNEKNEKKIGAIRNALESINTSYTVLMDADSWIVEPKKLPKLIKKLFDEDLAAGGVQVLPDVNDNSSLLEKIQYIEYKKAMQIGRKSMNKIKEPSNICISGAFGAFKTNILREVIEIQYKDLMFEGDDFERTLYFLRKGEKIGYFEDFIVKTLVPKNIKELTKQRINWQCGYLDKHGKFRDMLKRRDRVGATFWYNYVVNIGLHPLKLISLPFLLANPLAFLTFYIAYTVVEAAQFYSVSKKEEWKKYRKYIPLVPFYGLYHLAVPTTIGYIKGIEKFAGKRNKTKNKS